MADGIDWPDGLVEAEERLRRAILAADVALLEELLADDLLFVDQTGRVLTREMDLDAHRSGRLRLDRADFAEQAVRAVGDAVLVVLRAELAGTWEGTRFAGAWRYSRLWRRAGVGWQVAAAHCSQIA